MKSLAVTHCFRAIVAEGEVKGSGQKRDPSVVVEEKKGGCGVKMLLIGCVEGRQGRDKLPDGVKGHSLGRHEGRGQGGGVEGGKRGEELVLSSR